MRIALLLLAALMALEVMVGQLLGVRELTSWLPGTVRCGLVSCISIICIVTALLPGPRERLIPAAIMIAFCFVAQGFHTFDARMYPVPAGTAGWYSPSSATALMAYMSLGAAAFMRPSKWRDLIVAFVATLASLTIAGWLTGSAVDGSYTHIGRIGMSLPSAVMLLVICVSEFLFPPSRKVKE